MPTTKPASQTLSIVIPVYNERYTFDQLLQAVLHAPLPASMEREVIVVDDASTDGSWEIIQRETEGLTNCILHHQDQNQGKGGGGTERDRTGYGGYHRDPGCRPRI